MERDSVSHHSTYLDRDMDVIVYGDSGQPVIALGEAGVGCTDLEDHGMVAALAEFIDSGRVQLFCVGNVDAEGWLDRGGDPTARETAIEAYYEYLTREVIPFIHKRAGSDARPLALGCDLGATHAALLALRWPDLVQGCVALSGVYDASFYFGDWASDATYANSPVAFLANMPADHPFVSQYRRRQLLFCCGTGLYEQECERTQRLVEEQLGRMGVDTWCDYWGADVSHGWDWWNKQVAYFMPYVLEDIDRMAAEDEAAKPAHVTRTAASKVTAASAAKPAAVAAAKPAAKKAATKAVTKRAAAAARPAEAEPAAKKAVPATSRKAAPKAAAKPSEVATKPAAKPSAKTAKPAATAKAKPAAAKKATTATRPAARKRAARK